ncbi:MAG: four helix bundle protein [Ignavibacteriaceae bacterium]|nr:four helix bundle protein [Ignavibacteriaceae bacterium]
MTNSKFEDLEIYQLAEKLSDLIWSIVIKWDSFPKNTVGVQYVDASDSIGSNISEGYGKGSFADRSRYAKISRGSLFETIHWTKKSKRRNLLTDKEFKEIFDIIDILLPKLSSYINYLDESAKKKKYK